MSRMAVHLLIATRPAPVEDAVRVDVAAGRDVVLVVAGDRVLDTDVSLLRDQARVLALEDDVRRRGLPLPGAAASPGGLAPDGLIDYDGLVDLIASAERVVSW